LNRDEASVAQIVKSLEDALMPGCDLVSAIKTVQQVIWTTPGDDEHEAWSVLRDLAYDLDFFEPNPRIRAEDPSFFDEDRARSEIREALARVRASI
jgi:hypothetical protein